MEGRGLDYVAQERDTRLDTVNMALHLQVAYNARNFLAK
jgi:hypothetical protein